MAGFGSFAVPGVGVPGFSFAGFGGLLPQQQSGSNGLLPTAADRGQLPSPFAPPAVAPPAAGGALSGIAPQSPFANLGPATTGDVTPFPLVNSFNAPEVDPNYARNMTTLTNKYNDMADVIGQLPDSIRNSLIDFDSKRVANGSPPMTKQQTQLAIQTAMTNQQATPQPERNPLSFLSNLKADASDILKSIPRLPISLFHEATSIPNIGSEYFKNSQHMNPLSALLASPGVRLIPGAFTVGNALNGTGGLRELATHPLMTALDVLPGATKAAELTERGGLAAEMAKDYKANPELHVGEMKPPRPLTAFVTGKVFRDEAGNLTLGRNGVGQAVDVIRNDTRVGQALDSFGGARNRMVSRLRGGLEQRYNMLGQGLGEANTPEEALMQRQATILSKYKDDLPFLATDKKANTPEMAAQRAEFYAGVQRNPENYNPAMVDELRQLQYDFAKHQEAAGSMGQFDNEWYDKQTAKKLQSGQARVEHSQRMLEARNEYLNPSGNLTVENLKGQLDSIVRDQSPKQRSQGLNAIMHQLDAHGVDVDGIKSVKAAYDQGKATIGDLHSAISDKLDDAATTLTPRRSVSDIIQELRKHKADRQATKLEMAVQYGKRNDATAALKNLMDRKPSTFPDELYPQFREDVRSASRRVAFDEQHGALFTEKRLAQRQRAFEKTKNSAAPARFHGLLSDELKARAETSLTDTAEKTLGRQLTDEEAGQLVRSVQQRNWQNLPGIDPAEAEARMRGLEREVTATWKDLRESGADPVFVHKVSPGRANQALAGNINPVPVAPSQSKARVLDLSPGVNDLQVSLRHQAGELLQQKYNEDFISQVIDRVGVKESDLRAQLAEHAWGRAQGEPTIDFEGHLQAAIKRGWEKFNPEEAGTSWGGVKLSKYSKAGGGEDYFIPKSIASNLHSYAKPPSLFTSLMDPINKMFRYNVIALSPSVVVNNFFSNAVAMTAESGLTPWRNWSKAWEWLKDPSKIPSDELRGMILAEHPNMESLDRSGWLKTRPGQKFMEGYNASKAFQDNAVAQGAKLGKKALDAIAERTMWMQRYGDNIYRAMQYIDEHGKALRAGKSAPAAEHAAMEMVRRTLVDFSSFTPIERQAMRSIIPFYSYMGHAARFVMRYPLDHPMRMDLTARLADIERERLGALPGSFMSMLPLGGIGSHGMQSMLTLRPFSPFGDQSDMLSVSGWLAAANPLIQTGLQQAGVVQGQADLYPTLRYDPQSGRMVAVHGSFLSDLFNNAVPRAELLTSALGLNPAYSEARQRDPAAANRMLLTMAGLPRLWRGINVPQEQFKAEIARQDSASKVKNDALRSGNWNEAMRYPSLHAYFDALHSASPEQIAQMTPADQQSIAAQIRQVVGG